MKKIVAMRTISLCTPDFCFKLEPSQCCMNARERECLPLNSTQSSFNCHLARSKHFTQHDFRKLLTFLDFILFFEIFVSNVSNHQGTCLKGKVTPKMKVSPGLSDSVSLFSNPGCQMLFVKSPSDSLPSALVLEVQKCFRNFCSYFQSKYSEM